MRLLSRLCVPHPETRHVPKPPVLLELQLSLKRPLSVHLQSEDVRTELVAVQRELAGVREQAQGEVRARERQAQESQARQALVCSLEGQLDASHTLTNNLTKEIKRCVEGRET